MTDVEKLTLDAIAKVGKQVNHLNGNLSSNTAKTELLEETVSKQSDQIAELSQNTAAYAVKIDKLEETVDKLNQEVRIGNGRPSLISRMRSFEEGQKRAETNDGGVALAKVKAGKEVWLALIIACGAAFAAVISLFKNQ